MRYALFITLSADCVCPCQALPTISCRSFGARRQPRNSFELRRPLRPSARFVPSNRQAAFRIKCTFFVETLAIWRSYSCALIDGRVAAAMRQRSNFSANPLLNFARRDGSPLTLSPAAYDRGTPMTTRAFCSKPLVAPVKSAAREIGAGDGRPRRAG
jgi:hypothetical protein